MTEINRVDDDAMSQMTEIRREGSMHSTGTDVVRLGSIASRTAAVGSFASKMTLGDDLSFNFDR